MTNMRIVVWNAMSNLKEGKGIKSKARQCTFQMVNFMRFTLKADWFVWCKYPVQQLYQGSWMTYYIWVSVLSEEDVCPKKFGRKKHRVFKMHIVVPSRIFLFHWRILLFSFEDTWCREWGEDCCSVSWLLSESKRLPCNLPGYPQAWKETDCLCHKPTL